MSDLVYENLLARTVGDDERIATCQITADGLKLLSALHPDCKDPDQVCRIALWQTLPVDEAKAKINRYLRTFFGKQKRYLGKLIRDGSLATAGFASQSGGHGQTG